MNGFLGPIALRWATLLCLSSGAVLGRDPDNTSLATAFRSPPAEVRPRIFWRVFGPAWEPREIDYQLGLLKDAGLGGVTLFLFYPVAVEGNGVHNQRFLSAEFLDTLGYAARKAHQLGLRFSVAGGTGWPFGGPGVSIVDAAQRVRQIAVPTSRPGAPITLPKLQEGERLVMVFCGTKDVTLALTGGGKSLPPDLEGPLSLYLAGPTGMRVKRPALGGEGLVLDHYNSAAARRYLDTVVGPMLEAAPGLIESVFCDSLEVYRGNWTLDLPTEFHRRRGYLLTPCLPNLFDNASSRSPDLGFDFWRTLAELTEERFTKIAWEWAHHHRVRFEMEAYGTPPNPLTAARYIDVPTGEQYEWRGFSLSRLAASGAHLAGKRIIGAEAWTWLGLPNRLADSLSDMKLASDLHFLAGVNDLTCVDFAYSPRDIGAPGWLPYYGPALNQNNPQWPWFRYLANYSSRCQWMLRQGKPVADVAVYLPVEDKFALGPVDQLPLGFELRDHFVSGEKTDEFGLRTALRHHSDLIETLFRCGLNYDGIDFFSINRLAHVSDGKLNAGDGSYRVIIWPRLVGLESGALEKVIGFCRSGGTIIATGRLPDHIYGAEGSGALQRSGALLHQLFGDAPTTTHSWRRLFGRGQMIYVPDENESLQALLQEFSPDLRFDPPQPEVGFVHRRTGTSDVYFLANVGEHPRAFQADFRARSRTAELWDPMNGDISGLRVTEGRGGSRRIPIDLAPRSSMFVVFGPGSAPGSKRELRFQTEEIKPIWQLAFMGTNAPGPRSMTNLVSWTTWPDGKFFSGLGTYTGDFPWVHPASLRAWLRLSQIREVADVRINGQLAGPLWTLPSEVEITPWLKPGTNSLSITVANLPLNLFLGVPDEDLGPLRSAYGDRFPAPEEKRLVREPAPSGLIGPVFIRFAVD